MKTFFGCFTLNLALCCAFLGIARPASASPSEDLRDGTELSFAGRHEEAAQAFEKLTIATPNSADAWYNYGVAASQAGHYGQGIHAFEQALLLSPQDTDAAENAAKVRQAVIDRALQQNVSDRVILPGDDDTGTSLLTDIPPKTLAILFSASWGLFFLCLCVMRFKKILSGIRTSAAVFAVLAALSALGSGSLLAGRITHSGQNRIGVLIPDRVEARTGPGKRYPVHAQAMGGVRVHLRGQYEGWMQITLPDGSDAWIEPNEVKPLNIP